MRKPKPISDEEQTRLAKMLKKSKTKEEFQHIQCILIRSYHPYMTALDISNIVGLSESSVWRIQANYNKQGSDIISADKRGGRHRENLSIEAEKALLETFFDKAATSGIIVVKEVQLAYEKLIGHEVPESTIYRMLARHGWRKIVPFKRHPKADQAAQEAFKKTSGFNSVRVKQPRNKG